MRYSKAKETCLGDIYGNVMLWIKITVICLIKTSPGKLVLFYGRSSMFGGYSNVEDFYKVFEGDVI